MSFEDIKKLDDAYVMHTYGRYNLAIDHGKGAICYDPAGKSYIDFTSGIGVNSLGFADEGWVAAVTAQLNKLQHISNLYYTEPCVLAAKLICEKSGMKKVFFGNSGAEANEGNTPSRNKVRAEVKLSLWKTPSMAEPWRHFPQQDRTYITTSSSPLWRALCSQRQMIQKMPSPS